MSGLILHFETYYKISADISADISGALFSANTKARIPTSRGDRGRPGRPSPPLGPPRGEGGLAGGFSFSGGGAGHRGPRLRSLFGASARGRARVESRPAGAPGCPPGWSAGLAIVPLG